MEKFYQGTESRITQIIQSISDQSFDFLGRHEKSPNKKVLQLKSPKSPTNFRPNLTKPNYFDQSYVLSALMPAAGFQDPSKA